MTGRRFVRAVRMFLTSEVRAYAWSLIGLLVVFALSVNGLNVLNSYVGRDFMTALAQRDADGFARLAVASVAVLAAITGLVVLYRFTEERLGVLWRDWLTRRLVELYLTNRMYYSLKGSDGIDNPDQRIADDVRAFTATTLSFTLITLNGGLAAVSFSGVLIAISPSLFGVAVVYAVLGTYGAIWLGKPLVRLNYQQSDAEADFRANLVHVREHAESIALARREGRLTSRLLNRVDRLIDNVRRIVAVNRNLSFFTTGYNYFIPLLPVLIIGPRFMRGETEFGTVTQSAAAFGQLVGAFSLVITQFQSISSFAAVIARLSELAEAVERMEGIPVPEGHRFAFEGVTLRTDDGRPLVTNLTAEFAPGCRVRIVADDIAGAALLRAAAGITAVADGRIVRPSFDDLLFLPERPYLPPGKLREILLRSGSDIAEADVRAVLAELGVDAIETRVGGFTADRDWRSVLSLGEQQALAVARVALARPKYVMIDRADTALGPAGHARAVRLLTRAGVGVIDIGAGDGDDALYERRLRIDAGGAWQGAEPPQSV